MQCDPLNPICIPRRVYFGHDICLKPFTALLAFFQLILMEINTCNVEANG